VIVDLIACAVVAVVQYEAPPPPTEIGSAAN
jgi:hypothetical protein